MLLTCIESLHCITEALRDTYAEDVREALRVLNQFPEAFDEIDKKLSDPVLKDICRNLPELHFGLTKALIETPAKTIKDAYFKRTGKMLTESFCTAAYHTIRAFDIEQGKIPVQKHCSENSLRAAACKDAACSENSLRAAACRDAACSENSLRAAACKDTVCRDNSLRAAVCKDAACSENSLRAAACKDTVCRDNSLRATACKDAACSENSLRAAACKDTVCRENSSRNTICGKNTCRDAACSGGN